MLNNKLTIARTKQAKNNLVTRKIIIFWILINNKNSNAN